MAHRTVASRNKLTGGALLGLIAAGALATAGLGSAPSANATCASFFGLGNSADCTSTFTSVAIAIGTGAQAHADGLFGASFSSGTLASAQTNDAFTFATALGDNAIAHANGLFGIAMQLGPNGFTATAGSGSLGNLGLNMALNVSPGTTVPGGSVVEAAGIGNLAVNLFGNGTTFLGHEVQVFGNFNTGMNLGGNNNKVGTTGNLNLAFNDFGSGNTVGAGPGPVAIAGAILQTGATITKVGPGFNINGVVVGGAAAVGSAKTSSPTGAAIHNGTGTAAPAEASGRGHKK